MTSEVDEVAALADDPPSADAGVLRPVVGRDRTGVDGGDDGLRPGGPSEELMHPLRHR